MVNSDLDSFSYPFLTFTDGSCTKFPTPSPPAPLPVHFLTLHTSDVTPDKVP